MAKLTSRDEQSWGCRAVTVTDFESATRERKGALCVCVVCVCLCVCVFVCVWVCVCVLVVCVLCVCICMLCMSLYGLYDELSIFSCGYYTPQKKGHGICR